MERVKKFRRHFKKNFKKLSKVTNIIKYVVLKNVLQRLFQKLHCCLRYELTAPSIRLVKYLLVQSSSFHIRQALARHCTYINFHCGRAVCVELWLKNHAKIQNKNLIHKSLTSASLSFAEVEAFSKYCSRSSMHYFKPSAHLNTILFPEIYSVEKVEGSVRCIHYFIS